MKRIIEKKTYNTETAVQVAEFWNNVGRCDFSCIEETLYITKKGAWFLHYFGGAATKYAISCGGNFMSSDEGIIALSEEEAYNWLEEHEETEAIEQYFSELIDEA